MSRQRVKKRPALTLIEMLICVCIMAVLMGILSTAMIQAQGLLQSNNEMAMLQSEARFLTSRLTQDLRMSSLSQLAIHDSAQVPGSHTIQFHVGKFANNTAVVKNNVPDWDPAIERFRFDPPHPENFVREHQGDNTVLSTHVKSIQFMSFDTNTTLFPDELRIRMRLERTGRGGRVYGLNTTAIVYMRN